MTDCGTALGQEGVGTDQLSYTYASSRATAFQEAPMELFSGELTRAGSGRDSLLVSAKHRLSVVLACIPIEDYLQ